jgi:predicted O-methyltransferase YrrM
MFRKDVMRTIKHLTPRYICNRINRLVYEKTHSDMPWLTKTANLILSSYLKPDDIGLEFGSGRSTIWLAKRISHLTSIENNRKWYNYVSERISKEGFAGRISLYLKETDVEGGSKEAVDSEYVTVVRQFEKEQLDFVLVDGVYRSACANSVIDYIRDGGLLIIDDSHRYLPSNSKSPGARSYNQGPVSKEWEKFYDMVFCWRFIWTSNGVSDTAFYFKPFNQKTLD